MSLWPSSQKKGSRGSGDQWKVFLAQVHLTVGPQAILWLFPQFQNAQLELTYSAAG